MGVARLLVPVSEHVEWPSVAMQMRDFGLRWVRSPGDTCCICFEDFNQMLPGPENLGLTPTAQGHFSCNHAVCRQCDRMLQRHANPRCPLCRQPRAHWLTLRP